MREVSIDSFQRGSLITLRRECQKIHASAHSRKPCKVLSEWKHQCDNKEQNATVPKAVEEAHGQTMACPSLGSKTGHVAESRGDGFWVPARPRLGQQETITLTQMLCGVRTPHKTKGPHTKTPAVCPPPQAMPGWLKTRGQFSRTNGPSNNRIH